MKRTNAAAWLMCGTLLGAPSAWTAQQAAPVAASAPVPPTQHSDSPALATGETAFTGKTYTVPAGTKVLLSLKSGVNTKTARPGDGVYLVSTFPVIVHLTS